MTMCAIVLTLLATACVSPLTYYYSYSSSRYDPKIVGDFAVICPTVNLSGNRVTECHEL